MTESAAVELVDPERKKNVQSVRGLLERSRVEIAKSLPRAIDSNRFLRILMTYFQTTKGLDECEPMSFLAAVMQASQFGLEVGGPLSEAYIIPRTVKGRRLAGFQMGYRGYQKLALQHESIEDIFAEVVYQEDTLKPGDRPDVPPVHRQTEDDDPGPLRAVYAIAVFDGGRERCKMLWGRDIARIKTMSDAYKKGFGPWIEHEDAMWRKSAIAALCRTLPYRVEALSNAISAEETDDEAQIESLPGLTSSEALPESRGGALDAIVKANGGAKKRRKGRTVATE